MKVETAMTIFLLYSVFRSLELNQHCKVLDEFQLHCLCLYCLHAALLLVCILTNRYHIRPKEMWQDDLDKAEANLEKHYITPEKTQSQEHKA